MLKIKALTSANCGNLILLKVLFIFSLLMSSVYICQGHGKRKETRKMVLGSRPPACVNKCRRCRPCEATLVIPPHQLTNHLLSTSSSSSSSLNGDKDDSSYYLLGWKCRCGNRLYQP